MLIKRKSHFTTRLGEPKIYLITIISHAHLSWDFCMRMLTGVFHKSEEDAKIITNEILTHGEGFCGGYLYEIAENKALTVENQAKREGFSLSCLLEKV